jgi:ribonuclease P protein component
MFSSGLRPEDRLRHRKDFLRVYRVGKRIGGGCFLLYYTPGETDHHRLGLTVSKKVGSAVFRNRVKRRMRETFRLNREALGAEPLDLVFNVSPSIRGIESTQLRLDMLRTLDEARRGGGKPRGRRSALRPFDPSAGPGRASSGLSAKAGGRR